MSKTAESTGSVTPNVITVQGVLNRLGDETAYITALWLHSLMHDVKIPSIVVSLKNIKIKRIQVA